MQFLPHLVKPLHKAGGKGENTRPRVGGACVVNLSLLATLVGKLDISRHLGYNVAQEEVNAMAVNSVVRARIDERTKKEAAAALKKIGLTVSDAFRLLLVRVAAEKALPFEPLNPNAETVAAMKAARRGKLIKVGKPDKLLRSLNEGS